MKALGLVKNGKAYAFHLWLNHEPPQATDYFIARAMACDLVFIDEWIKYCQSTHVTKETCEGFVYRLSEQNANSDHAHLYAYVCIELGACAILACPPDLFHSWLQGKTGAMQPSVAQCFQRFVSMDFPGMSGSEAAQITRIQSSLKTHVLAQSGRLSVAQTENGELSISSNESIRQTQDDKALTGSKL